MASLLSPGSMNQAGEPLALPSAFETFSHQTLATLLDQSLDCIKLIGVDGTVQFMNRNGRCAMEVDDFRAIAGRPWPDLWPDESRPLVVAALEQAELGGQVRFDAFCPTAKGSPRWWDVSVSKVRDESGEMLGYLSVSRDVTELHAAKQASDIAAAEMRHRLRNNYAMVGGLLAAFARGTPGREEFVREMRDRLAALGVAQTLFVGTDNAHCNLKALLPTLLEPFSHPHCEISFPDLPDISVGQGQADAIALVLGELAVNATKHGALHAEGEIVVRASLDEAGLAIVWTERSTRRVEAHARSGGQGLRLMERILAARKGNLTIAWQDFGLEATLRFAGD